MSGQKDPKKANKIRERWCKLIRKAQFEGESLIPESLSRCKIRVEQNNISSTIAAGIALVHLNKYLEATHPMEEGLSWDKERSKIQAWIDQPQALTILDMDNISKLPSQAKILVAYHKNGAWGIASLCGDLDVAAPLSLQEVKRLNLEGRNITLQDFYEPIITAAPLTVITEKKGDLPFYKPGRHHL
eukprot:Protomagalhaensia_wolfi_Nauph_80__4005@NODE_4065_length_647_cov_25_330592_g3222_i0_p1_GENE_NODE_4065_length_647_cov_25_330592_g3222_i0NODE_4065_length_647_cov_25_330592_g3222_i0_p1_ORF_typecomplete_len187_score27_30_NODE_4065_length_647_cov_25_330592_g3222_i025585